MWILQLIGFLIPFIYIGYLMSKLDKFLAKGGLIIKEDEIYSSAIVLGETDIAKQTTELLQKNAVYVLTLKEPFLLEQEQNFGYLFALSDKDIDNIILCKVAKKVYSIEKIISLCNDGKNEGMFMSEKIRYFSGENITAEMLYHLVLQETEVKV